jgi:GrpB-like predicted nucleotidyltransferase (UPF0157 family)
LRDHPAVAREYGRLKRRLAKEHDLETLSGRDGYANAKGEFIERIVRIALEG